MYSVVFWHLLLAQENYTARASVSLTAVGGMGASFSGGIGAYKTTVKQSVGSTDFVVEGYGIGGRCKFDYDVSGTVELTKQVRVAAN